MSPETIKQITAEIAEAAARFKADRSAIFMSHGVSSAQYYDAFWGEWMRSREAFAEAREGMEA